MRIGCFCLLICLLTCVPCRTNASIRTSLSSGDWSAITWLPSGTPTRGDTIVINSAVTGMPTGGVWGAMKINAGGSLAMAPGVAVVAALDNRGMLTLPGGAVMKIRGDVRSDGTIAGDGVVEMTNGGSLLAGGGFLGNIVLNIGSGGVIHAGSSLLMESLYAGAASRLQLDSFNLTVRRSYTSATPLGAPGITATTGTITLDGPVHGAAQGNLRFGVYRMEGSRSRPVPPAIYGIFGDTTSGVTFTGPRHVAFSTLKGSVVIDSGATVTATGIGTSGGNVIDGTLLVRGMMTALDDHYLWKLTGDLYNYGRIDECTVQMQGHEATLRTDGGIWGNDASLTFLGDSGSELRLIGSMTLPRLIIGTLSSTDSGVTVDAGANEILVRHRFTSDRARSCRLVSDTTVRLRDDADGIIVGDVNFEGFWESGIGGEYGGEGRSVSFTMPKLVVSPLVVTGSFAQSASARLTVRSTATIPPSADFTADLVIDTGATVIARGDVTLRRGARGGGALELIAPTATLDVQAPVLDSLLIRIGRDTLVSHIFVARTFSVARMIVHPFSTFTYGAGDSVDVTQELRYRIAVAPGFSMMSSAVVPFDPAPAASFPGASSSVFEFDPLLGYLPADSIRAGHGYWVSFPASGIIEQRGGIINAPFASPVHEGWNIIGGASIPIGVDRIGTVGTLRTSDVYAFMGGYGPVTSIAPGHGYWVRFDAAGRVLLNP